MSVAVLRRVMMRWCVFGVLRLMILVMRVTESLRLLCWCRLCLRYLVGSDSCAVRLS